MARILIIGAGLTGLSTAYHLEQQNFFDFKVFEKEATCGGLARSVTQDGFTFDFTGHLLHCNDSYFQSFLDQILPQNSLDKIRRNSCVYLNRKLSPYPFQMNLGSLEPQDITQCLVGFAKRKHQIQNPQNFHDWVLKYFGTGIGKHFFFPYNSKLLAYDLKKVTPCWAGRFVPETSMKDLLEGLQKQGDRKNVGYNHHFFYPKSGGIQSFVDSLRKQVKSTIQTNHEIESINLKKKTITCTNGKTEPFETLVTTMPLDHLLNSLEQPSHVSLQDLSKKLLCNSVLNFNIGSQLLNKIDKQWIYIPEKKYPFYRVGFWHNISPSMAPKGQGSLYGEVSYLPHKTNKQEQEKILEKSIKQTLAMFDLSHNDLTTEKNLHLKHAYVIYNHWRANYLQKIHNALNKYSIYSVGRYGEWKYSSMQDAILDGKQVATNILARLFLPAAKYPPTPRLRGTSRRAQQGEWQ